MHLAIKKDNSGTTDDCAMRIPRSGRVTIFGLKTIMLGTEYRVGNRHCPPSTTVGGQLRFPTLYILPYEFEEMLRPKTILFYVLSRYENQANLNLGFFIRVVCNQKFGNSNSYKFNLHIKVAFSLSPSRISK